MQIVNRSSDDNSMLMDYCYIYIPWYLHGTSEKTLVYTVLFSLVFLSLCFCMDVYVLGHNGKRVRHPLYICRCPCYTLHVHTIIITMNYV